MYIQVYNQCVSDPDHGIRIEMAPLDPYFIGNTDPHPDPGQSKWKKNLRFQVQKSNDLFAEGLMVFTRGWESSINVFTAICDWK